MKHPLIRRAAPWLIAASALATFPAADLTATAASAGSPDNSQQTTTRVIARHSISSFAQAAAASRASGSSTTSPSNDGIQAPRRGGLYQPTSSARAAAGLAVPTVTPSPVSGTSGAVHSFAGINAYQERHASSGNQFTFTPPDQGMCVGNGYVMESVNDAIGVYDKTGKALTPTIGSNAFYGYPPVINRTTGESGPELTDPTCYFDPQYSRWFQVVLTLDRDPASGALTLGNHIDVAVSASDSPLGGWVVYSVYVTDDGTNGTPKNPSCPCIGDYPHIGADQFGFYVTTNEYPFGSGPGAFGNNYNGAQIYAFSKFGLAQNSGSVTVVHRGGHLALADGTPSFTLWPSEVPGTAYDTRDGGTEWFSQSTAAIQETNNPSGMSNRIALWRLTNTQSLDTATPALSVSSKTLSSQVYGVPPAAEQKVGPVPLRDCLQTGCITGFGPTQGEVEGPLDSNDSRMQSAWLAGGQIFTALDTIVDVGGRYQAGVAYFIVNLGVGNGGHVAIASQGYAAVKGNITYPSIATGPDGTGAMALTLVGSAYYPSAAYMTVGPTGPTGSVTVAKSGAGPQDDFCEYNFFNCASSATPTKRPRWGDYGAAAIDGTQVWIASEYIGQTCTIDQYAADPSCGGTRATLANWGTRITQVTP